MEFATVLERCDSYARAANDLSLSTRQTTQIAIGIGDLTWAQQCFRVAVGLDPAHAEAWNNLAVLEMRRGNADQVRAYCFHVMHSRHVIHCGSPYPASHQHLCKCAASS